MCLIFLILQPLGYLFVVSQAKATQSENAITNPSAITRGGATSAHSAAFVGKASMTAPPANSWTTTEPPPTSLLPIGATYHHSMQFPVLGKQAFQLHIISDTQAHLRISGMLNVDEVVPYETHRKSQISFNLSEQTKQILRKFKTKLLEAGYDEHTDTPYVKVAPYVLPAVKINMGRVSKQMIQ